MAALTAAFPGGGENALPLSVARGTLLPMPTDEDFAELTQLLETDELEEGPRLIATHYTSPEEAIEMVRAAQLLGLGVRLSNRLRIEESEEDGEETASEEWVLDLLESPPETDED
jgi:hypothetical protein